MKDQEVKEKTHRLSLIVYVLFFIFCFSITFINRAQSYYYYQRISFRSAGSTLYCNLYYPSKPLQFQDKSPLVIYAHGLGSQRDIDIRIVIELTKRGFFVAALDYTGQGESSGEITNFDPKTKVPALAQDCSKLLNTLEKLEVYKKEIDQNQIGLIGHSLGGMVVLMNGALDDRFKATVAWAPLVSFDPDELGIKVDKRFEDYIPENLINENNSENLLIIHHMDDELVNFEDNALLAHKLTNCKLIRITKSLGSPHQLINDQVLIETIKWFEKIFFNSREINGPIYITYYINYTLLGISLIVLFLTIFYFMNYISQFFDLKIRSDKKTLKPEIERLSKKSLIIKILNISLTFLLFISIWLFFTIQYGLIGIFYASVFMLLAYFTVKLWIIFKQRKKNKKIKVLEVVKNQYNQNDFAYTILCTIVFLGFYLSFSILYPFVFVFPSNVLSIVLALSVYPLYLVFEIFYRKIIYPKLVFINSEKTKTIIINMLAISNQIILISLNLSWAFLPAVLVFYFIFLIVIIQNSIIYAKTKRFITVIIGSFIIIEIFFAAAISQALGIASVLHLLI